MLTNRQGSARACGWAGDRSVSVVFTEDEHGTIRLSKSVMFETVEPGYVMNPVIEFYLDGQMIGRVGAPERRLGCGDSLAVDAGTVFVTTA